MPADAHRFAPNRKKIEESLLYLMGLAADLTQYDLVKALFLADRRHLNEYGRPVTFDNYVAMKHGPVPMLAYDALKPTFDFSRTFGEDRPWVSIPEEPGSPANKYSALRKADLDYLSETDMEALSDALRIVRSLSFNQLQRLTHEDPAYKAAWETRGEAKSVPIYLPNLVDDKERAERLISELEYISEHA